MHPITHMSKLSSSCGCCGLVHADMVECSLTYSSLDASGVCGEERGGRGEGEVREREERGKERGKGRGKRRKAEGSEGREREGESEGEE